MPGRCYFFSGIKLPPTCFKDAQGAPIDALDRPFPNGDVYGIRAPLTMPLLKGIDVLEGSLADSNVIESLDDYHAAVGAWARIMKTISKNKKWLVNPDILRGFGDDCYVKEPADISFSSTYKLNLAMIANDSTDDVDSLWSLTNQRIQQVRDTNTQQFIRSNPEKFPLPTAPSEKPAPKADTEEKTLLDGKHSRAVIGFMLALATVNEDDMTVTVPNLSIDFAKCFHWDTMELICRTYKSCIQDFMTDREEQTRDFLSPH